MTKITSVLLAVGTLALAGCGDDDDSTPAPSGPTTVNVALSEFSIVPTPGTVKAGPVNFVIKNNGAEVHEVVVVKTDLAKAQLPKNPDGTFNEEGPGVEALDEVEDLAAGATAQLPLTLAPGHHVLVCNILEGTESHFQEGMVADFTVQ